jgi:hypothetical protein
MNNQSMGQNEVSKEAIHSLSVVSLIPTNLRSLSETRLAISPSSDDKIPLNSFLAVAQKDITDRLSENLMVRCG